MRALAFDLLLPHQRAAALGRLVELIKHADYHLGTGFLSTPMLLPVLAANGRPEVAFRLLFQTTALSWLYQVEHGAATVWETWEGHDKKGNRVDRGDHNDHRLRKPRLTELLRAGRGRRLVSGGACWPVARRARLSPGANRPGGRRRAHLCRRINGDSVQHRGELLGTRGRSVRLVATVPPGSTGEVHLGDGRVQVVGSGTHRVGRTRIRALAVFLITFVTVEGSRARRSAAPAVLFCGSDV